MEGNVRVFVSIPIQLLNDIETHVKTRSNDRNSKIVKCLEAGLLSMSKPNPIYGQIWKKLPI